MSEDPFRYCVHCNADCYDDDPEHAEDCPASTGVWPVREKDLLPCSNCGHPHNQMFCMDCREELKAGDRYMHRQVDDDVYEIICVGCAAKDWTRA